MHKKTTQERLDEHRKECEKKRIAKYKVEREKFVSELPNFEDIEITFTCIEGKDNLSFEKRRFILKSGEKMSILKNLTQFKCEDNMDFDSEMVSKKHAVITYSHGRLSIMDFGSKHGTLKTSIDQVEQGLYPPYKNFVIQNNDRIIFGKITEADVYINPSLANVQPVVGKIQFYPVSSNSMSKNLSNSIILKPSPTSEIAFENRKICLTDGGEINIFRTTEHQLESSTNLTFNCGATYKLVARQNFLPQR